MCLSRSDVTEVLNRSFVPINVDVETLRQRPEWSPINAGIVAMTPDLAKSSFFAALLTPDGKVVRTMYAEFAHPDQAISNLRSAAAQYGTTPGEALTRRALFETPTAAAGQLRVLAAVRYTGHEGTCPTQTAFPMFPFSAWHKVPVQQYVMLGPDVQQKLMPAGLRVGQRWSLTKDEAAALLLPLCPPTGNINPAVSQVLSASLDARVASMDGGKAQVVFEGTLEMVQPLYMGNKEGDLPGRNNRFTTKVVGYATGPVEGGRVASLRIVTRDGLYATDTPLKEDVAGYMDSEPGT